MKRSEETSQATIVYRASIDAKLTAMLTSTILESAKVRETTRAHYERSGYLVIQLALGLTLGLGLAGQGEVGELELRALRVGSQQLGFLGVQEGESLRARPVRLYAHL